MQLNKVSASDKLYIELKKKIINLNFLPGDILSETEISDKYNVSRTPVREALKKLELEGLIDVKARSQTMVSLIDLDKISDIIYIREKIETTVAIELSKNPNKSQLFKLYLNLYNQENLLTNNNIEDKSKAFYELDGEFHELIFNICGKKGVTEVLSNLEFHYDRFRAFIDSRKENHLQYLLEDHFNIVKYIENGDEEKIKSIYQKHIYDGIINSKDIIISNRQYFINNIN